MPKLMKLFNMCSYLSIEYTKKSCFYKRISCHRLQMFFLMMPLAYVPDSAIVGFRLNGLCVHSVNEYLLQHTYVPCTMVDTSLVL